MIKDRCYKFFGEKKHGAKTNLYEKKILNTDFWKNAAVGKTSRENVQGKDKKRGGIGQTKKHL